MNQSAAIKNQEIINAFKNLDADLLDIVLDNSDIFQEVPRDIFIEKVRELFDSVRFLKNNNHPLYALPGKCGTCNKGQDGFSFVNDEEISVMEFLFEIKDGKIIDICPCSNFIVPGKSFESFYTSFKFFEEDKIGYVPTQEHLREAKLCKTAVDELKKELSTEGILYSDFCINWYDKYSELSDWGYGKDFKIFRYKQDLELYMRKLCRPVSFMKDESTSEQLFREFSSYPIIDEQVLTEWIYKCLNTVRELKFGFSLQPYFRELYCEIDDLKFDLQSLYYSQNIAYILAHYSTLVEKVDEELLQEWDNSDLFNDDDDPFL